MAQTLACGIFIHSDSLSDPLTSSMSPSDDQLSPGGPSPSTECSVTLEKGKKANPNSVSMSYGNQLHAAILQWYPSQAGKLTGMFLQNHDEEKVIKYLRRPNRLRTKIGTFARLLDTAATNTATVTDKAVDAGSQVGSAQSDAVI